MYKKLLSSLLLLGATTASYAQAPTLTAANFNPTVGNKFILKVCSPTGVTPLTAGANQVWDFTSLITTEIDTGIVSACSAVTPTCAAFAPMANRVQTVPAPAKVKNYLNVSTDSITQWGYHQASDTNLILTDPLIQMKFPFTYMTTFTDSFKGNLTFSALTPQERGEIVVNCDGWGLLKLPGRTDTALRVHMTETHRDSAHIVFGPLVIDSVVTYIIDQYVWYKPNYNSALLVIATTTQMGSTTPANKFVAYALKDATGVNDVAGAEAKIELFPNPSNGLVNLQWADMATGVAAVTVTDMTGRTVLNTTMGIRTANGQAEMNLQHATPGVYFVTVKAGNANFNGKVVIQ